MNYVWPVWHACEHPERPLVGHDGGAWHVTPYCRACDISIQAHVANDPGNEALRNIVANIAAARERHDAPTNAG